MGKRNYNFCIGNPNDGTVIKKFDSYKEREAYIKYLKTLPDQDYADFWGFMCRATCKVDSEYILNFHENL